MSLCLPRRRVDGGRGCLAPNKCTRSPGLDPVRAKTGASVGVAVKKSAPGCFALPNSLLTNVGVSNGSRRSLSCPFCGRGYSTAMSDNGSGPIEPIDNAVPSKPLRLPTCLTSGTPNPGPPLARVIPGVAKGTLWASWTLRSTSDVALLSQGPPLFVVPDLTFALGIGKLRRSPKRR